MAAKLLRRGAAPAHRHCLHQFLNRGRGHDQKLRLRLLDLLDDCKLLLFPVLRRDSALGSEVECSYANGCQRRQILGSCGHFLYQERALQERLKLAVIVAPRRQLPTQARRGFRIATRRSDKSVYKITEPPGHVALKRAVYEPEIMWYRS